MRGDFGGMVAQAGRQPGAAAGGQGGDPAPVPVAACGEGDGAAAPAVSVVLPTYNRAASLRAAMDSVLAQEGVALELIVVDDGSGDDSAQIVQGHPDPRVRLLRLEVNGGAAAARNAGIAAARAPWVAFQDSDDLWRPGKLAAQLVRADAPGVVAVYCAMQIEDAHGVSLAGARVMPGPDVAPREGRILPALLRHSFVSTQTLMVRRAMLPQLGGFDAEMPALQDWELMLRVAAEGEVAFVPEPLVVQRLSGDSLTRWRARRAQARARVLGRHAGLFARDRRALALQNYQLAGDARAIGSAETARRALAAAIRAAPLWWRPWAMRLLMALRLAPPGAADGFSAVGFGLHRKLAPPGPADPAGSRSALAGR